MTAERHDLSSLGRVELVGRHANLLAGAREQCGGVAAWRHRKLAEAHDLLALAQLSRRLLVHWVDLSVELRVLFEMRVPVACMPDSSGALGIAPGARIGLTYRQEAMRLPQPGYSFVQVLSPGCLWYPSVSTDTQLLCLGASLPAGILLKELVLMIYGALAMLTVQLDPTNAAGVLNPAAADWWQRNVEKIPLTNEPFIHR